MASKAQETIAGNFPTPSSVYPKRGAVYGERGGAMLLHLSGNPRIDNLRNYPADVVEKLRELLVAGAKAYPDPRRKKFYDVENGARMFYIHLSPTGNVWLLATWLKECQEAAAARDAALTAARL
jgi:hypothetical protein